jgi:hypothetical protein
MFTPRTLANGRVCCSNPNALCAKCAAAADGTRFLRTAAQIDSDFARRMAQPVPNPYASAQQRAAEIAEAVGPRLDPNYSPFGAAPNGYMIALALRRVLAEDEAGR